MSVALDGLERLGLDEGVPKTTTEPNVGSILGIGSPGWTGFVARAEEFAEEVRP